MILSEKIDITISANNKKHYLQWFDDIKVGDKKQVSIEMIPTGSHKIITCKCDICGDEKNIPYRDYIKSLNNGNIFTCNKCKDFKVKKTNLEKYGAKNYYNKEKSKRTCLEKYGVENVFQNEGIKKRIKENNLEKYGVEYTSQTEHNKKKSKETCIEKYGVEHHLKNKDILDKQHQTNLERYGVEHTSQNKEVMKKIIENSKKTRKETFLNKYKNNPNILEIDYENKIFKMTCNKGHVFEINFGLFHNRKVLKNEFCVVCNPIDSSTSDLENQLLKFIGENYNGTIKKNKKILEDFEIDIYLPDLKLGFEFNGLYWHSELFKDKKYHLNKTEESERNGIKLIHIYEDDWLYKQEIVKSRILNLLGKSEKIHARKCEIKEIENNDLIREFLNKNHLQGFVGSKVKIGLFYNDELVSLMTFGALRKSLGQSKVKDVYEMIRFCNKLNTNVIGGAGRMFKYFIEKYNPKEIISYADRSWSSGGLYEKLEFKLVHKTRPNYYYFKNKNKYHRFNFRKDILIKNGADPNKTEYDIIVEKGYYRIYDSGNLKFIWTS